MRISYIIAIVLLVGLGAFLLWRQSNQFDLPRGETLPFSGDEPRGSQESDTKLPDEESGEERGGSDPGGETASSRSTSAAIDVRGPSQREVFITGDVKHSIPINEILSGGPPKDGIPSIDNPKFIAPSRATFVGDEDVGLGLVVDGDARFYPYQILVWHEIVNDVIGGEPVAVTYCPLCGTGIVFSRRLPAALSTAQAGDDGEVLEFGVSGRLWQSNLLIYDRQASDDDETLWSQVLGEAVLGPRTGARLAIVSSDTVRFGDWVDEHPDTKVLSRDTGAVRAYGVDPYGDYYTNTDVSFGATFSDDRLHPKAFVYGIEIDGRFKAYDDAALPQGTTDDTFAGRAIRIEKDSIDGVRIFNDTTGEVIPHIEGFWFSWLAVHPETRLFN